MHYRWRVRSDHSMANTDSDWAVNREERRSNNVKSNQLESTESTVITTRSHLTFAVRECFEQMHGGDHFIFEHPSNASSWNAFSYS